MTRSIASCLLCLFLSIALPSGSPKFACASSIRSLSSSHRLPPFRPPLPIALTNTTNTTNATSTAPTPAAAPTEPTPSPTPELTKKYESPEDEEKDEEKKEGTKVGMIFLWIVVAFSLIWVICYFRDAILFFFANAWNNTRRYGCKGCMQSFFPCIVGSRSGAGGGGEPLDQIIFESEDANAPLMA